jgi:hypothetical protein
MTRQTPERPPFFAPDETTPLIEQATGVLVGAGCATPEYAMKELQEASRTHAVDLEELASALVEVASGGTPENALLRKVVWQEWGDLVPDC